MRIVVAVDNIKIKNEISKKYVDETYSYDINYMEGVIEYLSKIRNEEDKSVILITKDSLNGNLTKELYIKQIRLAFEDVKIILLTNKLSNSYKEFLFANEVFNVIEGDIISTDKIFEAITTQDKIVYLESNVEPNLSVCEAAIDYNTHVVIQKQFIAVYGTSGSGKSYVSSMLSKELSKKLNIKIAMLDMDIQNPCVDIYNNLTGAGNILSQVVEDVDKKRNISEIMDNYMYKDKYNNKVSYLTNNSSIFECQNKFKDKYYTKIYSDCINKFDYTVVDLPTSPFLDVVPFTLSNASNIFFVINPNYISLRQASKYLELLTKLWAVPKSSIFLIVNKLQKNSLSIKQIKNFIGDYDIVSSIEFNNNMEGYINGAIDNINNSIDISKILDKLNVSIKPKKHTSILKKRFAYDS